MPRHTTIPRRGVRVASALLAAMVLSFAPLAAQAVNLDRQGVALGGYDAVAYHTESRAVPGARDITAQFGGATWRFASDAHRATFLAAPATYLPAYGGYCAFGVSRGYKVKVDPEAFSVIGGTLYLNYDKGVQKQWLTDPARYIARADSLWPDLQHQPRR